MAEQSSLRVVSETDAKNPSEDKQDNIVADHKEAVAEAPASKPAPAPASVVAPPAPAPAPVKVKRKRGLTRPILFVLLPVALLVGGRTDDRRFGHRRKDRRA
jgi:membrane fusion protein (multidrug efflux system)